MDNENQIAIAVVGAGAILPDAPNVSSFWENVKNGRYSISEVTPDRWDPALYFDPDPKAADKTYSKIGGWVREFEWNPIKWNMPVPPRVADAMDDAQKWGIAGTRQALEDYGFPKRSVDPERTAVILGNAMAGERHYLTVLRLQFPEYARELAGISSFAGLPPEIQESITRELHARMNRRLPEVTEDTMPGELSNCLAGRIANLFNTRGPNFVVDAACASAMAAITAAAEGLARHQFDLAITGGIDRNMGASTFIKFCKIGALSATGTRPYAEGADGFVMGEGAAVFLLKRLADAERDGDKIYAVLRGIAGSSDGKGKGITAPNPIGQKLCTERAWENAGLSPATATLIEGHGTSTRVGDVVEVQSFTEVLNGCHLPPRSVALGSVKSNFGHLKGAAGAAGVLKTVLALRDKVLPPSLHCDRPNPDIDFAHSPLFVNSELQDWKLSNGVPRRAGVSAFGFGGTNFHAVFEEYVPGMLDRPNRKQHIAVAVESEKHPSAIQGTAEVSAMVSVKTPLRGVCLIGGQNSTEIATRLRKTQQEAAQGRAPQLSAPLESDLHSSERVAIDYGDAAELAAKANIALKAEMGNQPAMWKALRAQGIFRGHGPSPKVAFLYTGQGSQYVNMLRALNEVEPVIAATFAEADRVMTPILGKPLREFIFVDQNDPAAIEKAEDDLRQTAITQPAVLALDIAMTRLLASYGIEPDMTMGHSLGEYGALVASSALPFAEALEAVAARGREMTRVSVEDKGAMAAVFAPLSEIDRILKGAHGYVVIANINSNSQAVIGGGTKAVEQAVANFLEAGFNAVPLPVSHAFHTSIVAPASEPLRQMLRRLHLESPRVPVIANVNGEFYPTGPGVVPRIIEILARQVASPVQFVKGLQTLYAEGARVFVEVGPKKALQGFADDVLGSDPGVLSLFCNHPKFADAVAFNQALCGLYSAGLGQGVQRPQSVAASIISTTGGGAKLNELPAIADSHENRNDFAPVVITGAALGLPGAEHIFDDGNIARILNGEQFIDVIPTRFRQAMLDKHITRLVKSDNGGPTFETIDRVNDVIKLAGRGRAFDLEKEFGIPRDRISALDRTTQLAMAAGIDALRDAGIPLVMHYKATTKGTQLPDRWGLPDSMRDDTGVVFASVFPGYDSFADEMARYYTDREHRSQVAMLESLLARFAKNNGNSFVDEEIQRRIDDIKLVLGQSPYGLDRRFLLRALSMGHSQFAEFIGARGPNTQLNAACASTTQAIALAEDWIRIGRCRRVIIVSADDITTDHLVDWFGAAFLASGAAATDEVVEEAATPFDRRRHGMIMGMGAAAMVVESADAARERGIQPICEILGTATANSAFHPTRLSIDHIKQLMESLVAEAEKRCCIQRGEIARQLIFMSHETYTPARGGSASAEIHALRHVFGDSADQIVIANTKGFTGHAMGTGIEDVVAIKALETGCVPPVANFKEVDPELGALNLSKGGVYPVEYALRLGAGFGSQISMALLRWTKTEDTKHRSANALGYEYRITNQNAWREWLAKASTATGHQLEVVRRTLRIRDSQLGVQPATHSSKIETAVLATTPATIPAALMPDVPVLSQRSTVLTRERQTDVTAHSVKERILALVAEKTGYPEDMLDLDLDLEADLGVDTVKQAEVFAAIREIYDIPRDSNLKLRDFPTLAHVIRFVLDRRPDLVTDSPAPLTTAPTKQEAEILTIPPTAQTASVIPMHPSEVDAVRKSILSLMSEKTGYPEDMLDVDLDLEADLGVDTVKQAEMFAAIRERYNIPRDPNAKLRDFPTLKHVIEFVYSKRPDLAAPAPSLLKQEGPAESQVGVEPATVGEDEIRVKILDIVAAKTGYPKEMLDLDLDLEADLGIDTVKQAEMFAEVRAAYNIPRDANLKLRDFPTLNHVINFARGRSQSIGTETSEVHEINSSQAPTSVASLRQLAAFDAANRVPRRIPVLTLRPPLNICKETGIALEKGKRVLIMPDVYGVADALELTLRDRGVEVLLLDRAAKHEALEAQIKSWLAAGSVHGVYWLPAFDDEAPIPDMQASEWRENLRVRVKSLFTTMRALYDQIAGAGTFLVCGTRMGGDHGYNDSGALSPMGGAVTGFAKAFKRERPEVTVKAVDFTQDAKPNAVATLLFAETMCDPGAVEIGYKSGLRWTVTLKEEPTGTEPRGMTLDHNTVFVVTGAAGSIVSAITADLAAASGGTFYLLDLVPEPNADDPDLKRFATDKEGLKRELFARIQARGERATPALVEKELAGLERAQAALDAIYAVRHSGGQAHYFSVNLLDTSSVAGVIGKIKRDHNRIDVLLHAAGIERSHTLPDKSAAEFDLVFDVKADGWFNLLHALGDYPVGATVTFCSIAGRFGNGGQTDYSSANDLLCKLTSSLRHTRPSTRGIALAWTAWEGIGMASRGSIPKMMELAGIDMLTPEAGVPVVRRELTMNDTAGEIVIANRLGALMSDYDQTGGLDPVLAEQRLQAAPMIGRLLEASLYDELLIETTLDPKVQPFLYDHQIDGVPVLPGVMGIEAFAEAAVCLVPEWHIEHIEDVNFLAPFKFYRNEPRNLIVRVESRLENGQLIAQCCLMGIRALATQNEPQVTTHFTARVHLSPQLPEAQRHSFSVPKQANVAADSIYQVYFHGPSYRVLECAMLGTNSVIGTMRSSLPANHIPANCPTRVSPRLLELCFQSAGLWEIAEHDRFGLPLHIDVLRTYPAAREGGQVYARVTRGQNPSSFNAEVLDGEGNCFVSMEGYKTVALPVPLNARKLTPTLATVA